MTETRILDRIPSLPDPIRETRYNLASFEISGVAVAEMAPRSYTWWVPFHLNQGNRGACVPHGDIHEALARPKPVDFRFHRLPDWAKQAKAMQAEKRFTNQQIAQVLAVGDGYDWCRNNDEWPGMNYEGTSAAAGSKMMVSLGLWGEYRWAQSVQDFSVGVSRHGPGTMAIDWYTGMMRPDSDGFIHPTGIVEGGHQILCNAFRVKSSGRNIFGLWQSWGEAPIWWIYEDELEEVVSTNGEMAIPVTRLI